MLKATTTNEVFMFYRAKLKTLSVPMQERWQRAIQNKSLRLQAIQLSAREWRIQIDSQIFHVQNLNPDLVVNKSLKLPLAKIDTEESLVKLEKFLESERKPSVSLFDYLIPESHALGMFVYAAGFLIAALGIGFVAKSTVEVGMPDAGAAIRSVKVLQFKCDGEPNVAVIETAKDSPALGNAGIYRMESQKNNDGSYRLRVYRCSASSCQRLLYEYFGTIRPVQIGGHSYWDHAISSARSCLESGKCSDFALPNTRSDSVRGIDSRTTSMLTEYDRQIGSLAWCLRDATCCKEGVRQANQNPMASRIGTTPETPSRTQQ